MTSRTIIETECIDNGVLVTFDEGTSALFSAPYLFDHLDDADEVLEDPLGAEAPPRSEKVTVLE
jgi:hypothetical protein